MWTDPDDEPTRPDTWGPNPCRCGVCNVCGFYGLAPRPVVQLPLPAPPVAVERQGRTLFDAHHPEGE